MMVVFTQRHNISKGFSEAGKLKIVSENDAYQS